jgi:L-cystine uptake protein TcyP (sodium:dicarboxylate symporter family)
MKKLNTISMVTALLLGATAAQAQVGILQGTVTGVDAGTVLPVFKGDAKVADIKVEAGGKFSVALATGVYTVNCPNGKVAKVAALNGAATISINCQK